MKSELSSFGCDVKFIVWSSTDVDSLCQECLANHEGVSKPIHRPKDVMHLVPADTRAELYKVEARFLKKMSDARDEFKGTDMAPPTNRFADKKGYDI